MNWTPSERNSSSASKRCLVERAKRSKRQTKIESNFRLRASAMSSLSSGRESFAPDWPMSNVLANDGEAPSGAVRSQVTHLHLTALLLGAHSGVDSCSHTRIRTTEQRGKLGKKITQILAILCAALVFQKVRGTVETIRTSIKIMRVTC